MYKRQFKKFIDFLERMLLFYSLDSRGYEGFTNGNEGVAEGIVTVSYTHLEADVAYLVTKENLSDRCSAMRRLSEKITNR